MSNPAITLVFSLKFSFYPHKFLNQLEISNTHHHRTSKLLKKQNISLLSSNLPLTFLFPSLTKSLLCL